MLIFVKTLTFPGSRGSGLRVNLDPNPINERLIIETRSSLSAPKFDNYFQKKVKFGVLIVEEIKIKHARNTASSEAMQKAGGVLI
jgi:hypothetical protein